MHTISKSIVKYYIENGCLEKEKTELYVYSLERRLQTVIGMAAMIMIGTILFDFISVLLFVLSFKLLRECTGGYHLKSNMSCIIWSSIVMVLSLFISKLIFNNTVIAIITLSISIAIILIYAPVNHPNMNWNSKEFQIVRIYMHKRLIYVLISIIFCNSICAISHYSSILISSIFSVSLTVLLAKLLRQEVKK